MNFKKYLESYAFGASNFSMSRKDVGNIGTATNSGSGSNQKQPYGGAGGSTMATKVPPLVRKDIGSPPYGGASVTTAITKINQAIPSGFNPSTPLKYFKINPSPKWPKNFISRV